MSKSWKPRKNHVIILIYVNLCVQAIHISYIEVVLNGSIRIFLALYHYWHKYEEKSLTTYYSIDIYWCWSDFRRGGSGFHSHLFMLALFWHCFAQDKMLRILSRCLQWHCSIPWISVTESYRIYTVAVTSHGVTRFVVKCCQFLQDRNLSALSVSHPTRNTRRVSCSFQLGHAIQAFQACDRVLSNDASMHPRSSDWRNPYRFNRCNSM